jgi:dTDP-4-amino-4,6-dideoxygalactose transaminase
MTDIQAALGISQLKKLDSFIHTRQKWVSHYERLFHKATLQVPNVPQDRQSSWHLYIINITTHDDIAKNEASRNCLYETLKAANIHCNLHYWPIHLQPYYRQFGFKEGDFPRAEAYARTALTLPLHGGLTDEVCTRIAEGVIAHLA